MNAAEKIVEWRLIPQEVARHMDTSALEGFLWAEGILIPEGISALVLVNGKAEHRIGPGMYRFQGQRTPQITGAVENIRRFFTDLFYRSQEPKFTGESKENAEKKIGLYAKDVTSISVWLFRDTPFRAAVHLAPKRGGDGLDVELLVQIKDPHSLIRLSPADFTSPLDKSATEPPVPKGQEGITGAGVQNLLQSRFGDRMYEVLFTSMDRGIREQEKLFREEWAPSINHTGLEVVSLIGLASKSQADVKEHVQELEKRREELSVLTHLWKAQNQLARGDLLNQDEKNAIRHEVQKIGLLRDSEMAAFRSELLKQEGERAHQLETQSMLLADATRKLQAKLTAVEKDEELKLREDLETREARLEIAKARIRQFGLLDDVLEANRKQLKVHEEAEKQKIALEDERKNKKIGRFEKLVDLRSKIDESKANKTTKEVQAYAGMTPEQIMAINPNLTEAGALALSEKFKASSKEEAWKMVAEMSQKNAEEMRKFLEAQAKTQAEIVKGTIHNVRGEDARAEKRTKGRVDQVAKLAQKVRYSDSKKSSAKDGSEDDATDAGDRDEEES